MSTHLRGKAAAVAVADPDGGEVLTLESKGLLTRGIRKRRSSPIMAYVGLNGSFKTATMVRDTLPSLAQGRRVLSTVEILDPWTGNAHPLYVPFRSWSQLHDFRGGDVLLDEVTGIMDARDQGMPKHIRRLLPQMRRRNSMVRVTGIDWDNMDKRLRQVVQAVARCRGYVPAKVEATADTLSMWAPKRLAYVATFDAQTLRAADDTAQLTEDRDKKRRARVLNREWWWGPSSRAFGYYDTLADVSAVNSDCPVCGGRVPELVCKTPDVHREIVRELEGAR
ncbi:MAG TPA: hypothetical protein VGM70_08910 [Pseudolysinimonas sp.]|jgi:hypothetical protein